MVTQSTTNKWFGIWFVVWLPVGEMLVASSPWNGRMVRPSSRLAAEPLRWYSTCSGEHPSDAQAAVSDAVNVLKLERSFSDAEESPINFCLMTVGSGLEDSFSDAVSRARDMLGTEARLVSVLGGGVIGGGREREGGPHSVSLLAGALPKGASAHSFTFGTRRGPSTPYNKAAWAATEKLFREDLEGHRPSFLLFGDPYSPLDEATSFVDECAPSSVVVGGVSSQAKTASLAIDDKLLPRGSIAGIAFLGVDIHSVTAQGAVGVGPTMRVTRGRSNLVADLDDKPALERLRDVATAAAQKNPRVARLLQSTLLVGLAVGDDFLVRAVVGATPDGAVAIADDSVNADTKLRVHVRDGEAAKQDLDAVFQRYALEKTFQNKTASPPFAAMLVSCTGRGRAMYGAEGYDSHVFDKNFPNVPLAGFFANGEIGPVGARIPNEQLKEIPTRLHGFTSVYALFVDPNS